MLSRYTIYRRRPKGAGPLPEGHRQDTRWRTKHILRPPREVVEEFLADPTDAAWRKFRRAYRDQVEARYKADSRLFEELGDLASREDVYLGCSCPTKKNPDVRHCHTWLALEFMKEKFPSLEVVFPETDDEK